MVWLAAIGIVVSLSLLGLLFGGQIFGNSDQAAIEAPMPLPPTPEQLEAMTPKPRSLAAVEDISITTTPYPRVQVAEAPAGHVVYPVSPDANLTGKVKLKVVIATDGRVKQVRRLSGKPELVQAAENAVKYWRYRSHELNGMPAEAETNVTISFVGSDAVSLGFPSAIQNGSLKLK